MSESKKKKKKVKIGIRNLRAGFGSEEVLHRIRMDIRPNNVTALIGPSACGKSTLLRCLNRLHETVEGAWQEGSIELDGQSISDPALDPVHLRRRVGIVFQKPNPFPHLSIRENVLAGLRLTNTLGNRNPDDVSRQFLEKVALWDEVKDHLNRSGSHLSLGQQQRLCIARSMALEPEVLLMDEPCSSLDPVATARVEELIRDLREEYTIVIVTHSMQQAARISDRTAFLLMGELIEYSKTSKLFFSPTDQRTEDYITGKFG